MPEVGGCKVGYGNLLDAFPAWTDLSKISGWDFQRGRTTEFEQVGAGTARIYVDDTTGYLGATSEPAVHAQITLRGAEMWRGYVEETPGTVDGSGKVTRMTVAATDLFDYLSGAELVPGLHGHPAPPANEPYVFFEDGQVDDRMILVLTDVGVPAPLRSVFSGNVALIESVYPSGTTAMQVLDECAEAEWPGVANRFMDARGRFCFRGRHARFNPSNPTYGIQFWEAGTGSYVTGARAQIRELGITRSHKSPFLANAALSFPAGLDPAEIPQMIVTDASSINKWGLRSWEARELLTKRHLSNGNTGADEAKLFSTYQVDNRAQPVWRPERVSFESLEDWDPRAAATWGLITGVEIGDVLDLYTDWLTGRYFVEGITCSARSLNKRIPYVRMTLDLSPAAFWSSDPFS